VAVDEFVIFASEVAERENSGDRVTELQPRPPGFTPSENFRLHLESRSSFSPSIIPFIMSLSSLRALTRLRTTPITVARYGRAAAYRRIAFEPRPFSTQGYRFQASSPKEKETVKAETEAKSAEEEYQRARAAEEPAEEPKPKDETTSEESDQKSESESESKSEKPKENAPPPPHGDKTPWQVFMDTLKTEFESSKEWKDSTQALQSGYNEIAANPALQKAKSAYSEASKSATSTTSAALKTTGEAVAKGATWAWETPVAKVVRKGATVAGDGIEKVTRPVRETEAYKSVKDVIDDGSSSRYGGWTERDERRARRAKRDAAMGRSSLPENMETDPE
jgi:import inner membrane translocase subunit TIM44